MKEWQTMVDSLKQSPKETNIGVVGKYIGLNDAYKSIYEALVHASSKVKAGINIIKIDSENLTAEDVGKVFKGLHGVLIPGGFGERGIEGKIAAVKYVRENNIPVFGICLGMQLMVVEYARTICKLEKANSTEINPDTEHPVISLLQEQQDIKDMGGTMRLGAQVAVLEKNTKTYKLYKKLTIQERHRHRYEFNNSYRELLTSKGLVIAAEHEEKGLVEIIELEKHPWFIGVQFHPEFQSKPTEPHPLFRGFIEAAFEYMKQHKDKSNKPVRETKEPVDLKTEPDNNNHKTEKQEK
jgi:CTP synthase